MYMNDANNQKLDGIRLSPSRFGLQTYRMLLLRPSNYLNYSRAEIKITCTWGCWQLGIQYKWCYCTRFLPQYRRSNKHIQYEIIGTKQCKRTFSMCWKIDQVHLTNKLHTNILMQKTTIRKYMVVHFPKKQMFLFPCINIYHRLPHQQLQQRNANHERMSPICSELCRTEMNNQLSHILLQNTSRTWPK